VVDDFLSIPDILARLMVSKEQYGDSSLQAAVLLSADDPAHDWSDDPLLRHLIENSRPLSSAKMEEAVCIVNTWWNYRNGEGPQARLECGEIPVCMVTSDCSILLYIYTTEIFPSCSVMPRISTLELE
jgi:hypothetical protein